MYVCLFVCLFVCLYVCHVQLNIVTIKYYYDFKGPGRRPGRAGGPGRSVSVRAPLIITILS